MAAPSPDVYSPAAATPGASASLASTPYKSPYKPDMSMNSPAYTSPTPHSPYAHLSVSPVAPRSAGAVPPPSASLVGTPQRQLIPPASPGLGLVASPLPVTPAHADPVDEAMINSAAKVRSLARAASEASFGEEMSGCRYAAARARTSITEATLQNLQAETDERVMASERQQKQAKFARRSVDHAAKQADQARYKQLMAEKQLISSESARLKEEARIARLEAMTNQSQADIEYLHRSKHATQAAHKAAMDGLEQTKNVHRSLRRSVERTECAKLETEEKLRNTYGELSNASLELNQQREELIHATERERDAMLRRAAARNMETAALTYLTKIAPTSPARLTETQFAVDDIESARIAERAAETIASEARCNALVANDRLRNAEDRLIGANTQARMTDNEFKAVATTLELERVKQSEVQNQLACAKAIERESHVQSEMTKEQLVLNAQKLAQRRATLKRSKDKLKKLSTTSEVKKKEAIRQFQSADISEKVFVHRITKEQQARLDAEAALARARAAQESLTQTAVGLAYARQEEIEAQTEHDRSRQSAQTLRQEMEFHAATLQHLQQLSPRSTYLQSPDHRAA
eukprot:TRINITY_DN20750_c0_g1_i1.p1 TRINITY_DN20750_c0_g1~~TRINITY_DN20750_c0_g1_i1.p1  ORF type:complete len:581 (+),score=249.78 TRINITY_DN20750_c0_g1_i1:54-1796(+)